MLDLSSEGPKYLCKVLAFSGEDLELLHGGASILCVSPSGRILLSWRHRTPLWRSAWWRFSGVTLRFRSRTFGPGSRDLVMVCIVTIPPTRYADVGAMRARTY
jgi:hypothetical protein